MITGTTIGFGDDSPRTPGVRAASIVFLPFAVAVMGEFLGRVASTYLDRKQRKMEKKFLRHSLTLADIQTMDTDNDGKVDKAEFLRFMLVTLQRVEEDEIKTLMDLFNKLDKDKNGTLSAADLKENAGRRLRESIGVSSISSDSLA